MDVEIAQRKITSLHRLSVIVGVATLLAVAATLSLIVWIVANEAEKASQETRRSRITVEYLACLLLIHPDIRTGDPVEANRQCREVSGLDKVLPIPSVEPNTSPSATPTFIINAPSGSDGPRGPQGPSGSAATPIPTLRPNPSPRATARPPTPTPCPLPSQVPMCLP